MNIKKHQRGTCGKEPNTEQNNKTYRKRKKSTRVAIGLLQTPQNTRRTRVGPSICISTRVCLQKITFV